MFVVVFLISPKKRIIIPEHFVYDLCEERLKNSGCNKNHTYLIYWSKNSVGDGENAPDIDCVPNFNAPVSEIFPPENDAMEACYKVQLRSFFSKCISLYMKN